MKQKNMNPLRALGAVLSLALALTLTACSNELADDDTLNPNDAALTLEVGTYPGYPGDGVGTRAIAPLAPNETFTVNNTMWIMIIDLSVEQDGSIEQILKATATDGGTTWKFVTDATYDIALPTKLDETKEYAVLAYASASITGWNKTEGPTFGPIHDDTKAGLYDVLIGRYTIAANDAAAHKKIDFNTPNTGTTPRLYHVFDRIRFTASAVGYVVKFTASDRFKLPNNKQIYDEDSAISATAGTDKNVYFYGKWANGTTFYLNDDKGNLLFEATTTASSASNTDGTPGKSYHFTN